MTATGLTAVIILAAGEGKRMKSATPKVLHPIAGRSLLGHVVEAASRLEPAHVIVVVGHGRDAVIEHLAEIAPWAGTVVQEEQRGTGHAVRIALDSIDETSGTVLVLTGDTPLLTGETLMMLYSAHDGAAATVLTAEFADPSGYGRIVRDSQGSVAGIVEHRDASAAEREITEINSGMYVFAIEDLRAGLTAVTTDNDQGEEYLTDVIGVLRRRDQRVNAVLVDDFREVLGVNDREQLAQAAAIMRDRITSHWMREGVTVVEPTSTWIDVDVDLEPDVTILPSTTLRGPTFIARGAHVGPGTTLTSCEVGANARVIHTWAELAVIGADANVGPFTYLRPGTTLGEGAKAGAFVEIKNSTVGDDAKVPHLSYVGDAEIGDGSNIGAATVFVNYDGVEKHRTTIGDHVRIGSDTMLVAPVTVGDGAYTAAGSVITEDVPPGAMAVARSKQRNIDGWVARRRPGTASAQAASEENSTHESQEDR